MYLSFTDTTVLLSISDQEPPSIHLYICQPIVQQPPSSSHVFIHPFLYTLTLLVIVYQPPSSQLSIYSSIPLPTDSSFHSLSTTQLQLSMHPPLTVYTPTHLVIVCQPPNINYLCIYHCLPTDSILSVNPSTPSNRLCTMHRPLFYQTTHCAIIHNTSHLFEHLSLIHHSPRCALLIQSLGTNHQFVHPPLAYPPIHLAIVHQLPNTIVILYTDLIYSLTHYSIHQPPITSHPFVLPLLQSIHRTVVYHPLSIHGYLFVHPPFMSTHYAIVNALPNNSHPFVHPPLMSIHLPAAL